MGYTYCAKNFVLYKLSNLYTVHLKLILDVNYISVKKFTNDDCQFQIENYNGLFLFHSETCTS